MFSEGQEKIIRNLPAFRPPACYPVSCGRDHSYDGKVVTVVVHRRVSKKGGRRTHGIFAFLEDPTPTDPFGVKRIDHTGKRYRNVINVAAHVAKTAIRDFKSFERLSVINRE